MKLPTIYTIGHSTRTVEEFLELLQAQGVRQLADVRTVPRSRHNAQYNSETLARTLERNGIAYAHMPGLGGLRRAKKESVNSGWENASFRGFADHMQTPEFRESLEELMAKAAKRTTVILCAEAVPWRCHRSLIADALLVRGITVMDIMGRNTLREHSLTPWAEVDGNEITYPAKEPKPEKKRRKAERKAG